MLMGDELKTAIKEWGERVGELHARDALRAAGISYSAAWQLLHGKYNPEPKARMVATLNSVLKETKSQAV